MNEFGSSRIHAHKERHNLAFRLHLDATMLTALSMLLALALVIVYSAGGETTVTKQLARLAIGATVMVVLAQIPPRFLKFWSPGIFLLGISMLLVVEFTGAIGKGAQRWIDLGFMRFQPSEMLKLAVPMMLAWYFSEKPLPPTFKQIAVAGLIIAIPVVLIAIQPDLGTSLLILASGFFVVWLAGLSWKLLASLGILSGLAAPALWFFYMRDYQKKRVLTFLDPEKDPLGSGYHIIQSKIAVGSGGLYGKGYMQGTQSQLEFIPERHTDFIFAVFGEEFGFLGSILLLVLMAFIVWRGLYVAIHAQDTYSRLLAGAITLTFSVYVIVNIGMVIGLLPVVGVPLPLVSYGGTSSVTLLAGFGLLMSLHTHRRLLSS